MTELWFGFDNNETLFHSIFCVTVPLLVTEFLELCSDIKVRLISIACMPIKSWFWYGERRSKNKK